jgi:hypothetical protein
MDDHDYEASALDIQDRIAAMSDKAIRTAYLASDGVPGVPWIDALAQAMKERGIDD